MQYYIQEFNDYELKSGEFMKEELEIYKREGKYLRVIEIFCSDQYIFQQTQFFLDNNVCCPIPAMATTNNSLFYQFGDKEKGHSLHIILPMSVAQLPGDIEFKINLVYADGND